MIKGVAQAEEIHHTQVHSASRALLIPSVIRLLAYRHIPQQTRALSRKNILLRDRNTCQFCAARFLPRTDPGSRRTAISRRTVVLGESGRLLLPVQQQQGRPHPEEAGIALARRLAPSHCIPPGN